MAITVSVLQGGANSHQTTSEEINYYATDFITEGVVGTMANTSGVAPMTGTFAVNAQGTPDATVAVSTGIAYITATPTSGNSQNLRVQNSASSNVTISANSTGGTRYDWLYLKIDPDKAKDPNSGASDVATLVTSRSTSNNVDNGTPPTYGLLLAVLTVANGFTTISNGNIADRRTTAVSIATADTSGWSPLGYTPNTVTYNGNRNYSLVFNSVDLTGVVSDGMRLKATRTVSAPTQCTSLNGSTQYYSKSSPAGMTFTDDFVVSAWVKPTSYADSVIASRYNGTSGWYLRMDSSGQVQLDGFNAAAANFSRVITYQSLPLNKWSHVAVQLDMSAFTATTTTSYVMFDGLDIPASVSRGGTNPTSLVQAGNLEIGSTNGGTLPFPGKIAQVAIFNAKVTQATMRGYISQGLAGTETSLVSAYSFNNSINDLNTTNANNLTANGSAVATNADSPFTQDDQGTPSGTTDFGVITSKAFSTNTTLTVQVPEGCTIPTSGGVSSVSYSSHRAPYGFPAASTKWRLRTLLFADQAVTSNATYGSFISGGFKVTVPIGEWSVGQKGSGYYNLTTTNVYFNLSPTALTGLSATAGAAISGNIVRVTSAAASSYVISANVSYSYTLAAQTDFIMYTLGATTSAGLAGSTSPLELYADCVYL